MNCCKSRFSRGKTMRLDRTLNHILADYYRVHEDGLGRVCVGAAIGTSGILPIRADDDLLWTMLLQASRPASRMPRSMMR